MLKISELMFTGRNVDQRKVADTVVLEAGKDLGAILFAIIYASRSIVSS